VKVCGYCGRENDDASTHCRECGTEFPIPVLSSTPEAKESPLPASTLVNLDQIEGAFDFKEGFSRPDWKIIRQAVEATVDSGERREAWDEAVMQWLAKLQGELGGACPALQRSSAHGRPMPFPDNNRHLFQTGGPCGSTALP